MRRSTLVPMALALSLLFSGRARSEDWPPSGWFTPAEASGFQQTPSYAQTIEFLERLTTEWDAIRLFYFGTSAQGRPMPVVVVSTDHAFTPSAAFATGKAVVMIQNGIHAGEIDGKDASLMLLRDLALGQHRELLEGAILLIVPIYNVDGHERVSPYNRPNQDGPHDGMGFRTTADGHDLNRDHMKLDTPEARNLIGLFNRWRPQLHVDDHVTDGVDHDWVLTYSWAEAPQVDAPIDGWLKEHMPRALAATERAGHRVGPYAALIDRSDPSGGINSWVGEARYSSGYFPLRHVPSILVENHSYKPYELRVRANLDFLQSLIAEVSSDPRALIDAVASSRARTVSLGLPTARPSDVVIVFRAAPPTDRILFPVYEWYTEESVATGASTLFYREGIVREIEVPWMHQPEASRLLPRPRGYLVLPGWPEIADRLVLHDLRFESLVGPVELEVETLRISNPRLDKDSSPSYQGRTRIEVDVARVAETRDFPAGTLWIPADQPDFEVAVQLLEPDAPDSLVSWGLLSIALERKEYIGSRVLEEEVRGMLQDPKIAAEWATALQDETFASDPRARGLWWYRRTPYWDETVGLMPVMRVMTGRAVRQLPLAGRR